MMNANPDQRAVSNRKFNFSSAIKTSGQSGRNQLLKHPEEGHMHNHQISHRACQKVAASFSYCAGLVSLMMLSLGFSSQAASLYWDTNGATTGAGGATPAGIWGTDSFWSLSSAGTAATAGWTNGSIAVFSAGSDATGAFAVTLNGTQTAGGVTFEEGIVTLSSGPLSLNGSGVINVNAAPTKAIIASVVSGSVGLTKAGR